MTSSLDKEQHKVFLHAFSLCLPNDGTDMDLQWAPLAHEDLVVEGVHYWERPLLAIVDSKLFVFHLMHGSDCGTEPDPDDASPMLVHSISLDSSLTSSQNQHWLTSNPSISVENMTSNAAVVVQGTDVLFVLKRHGGNNVADSLVFSTISKDWYRMGSNNQRVKFQDATNVDESFGNNGSTILVGSSTLICPWLQEEGSFCSADNLACPENSVYMAGVQDMDEDIIDYEDYEDYIPWMDESEGMNDFGGFAMGSSLYIFVGSNSFSRHDFSVHSCRCDDNDDEERVKYHPTSAVAMPTPIYGFLDAATMVKVGHWLVCGGGGGEDPWRLGVGRGDGTDGLFQAIGVRPSKVSGRTTRRSNFLHLALEFHNKCINVQYHQPRDEQGRLQNKIDRKIPRTHTSFLLKLNPMLAAAENEEGKLPMQLALENGSVCSSLLRQLIKAHPRALSMLYPTLSHSLLPNLLACLQFEDGRTSGALECENPADIYAMLQLFPEALTERSN